MALLLAAAIPTILTDLLGLLLGAAPYVALGCFVTAALAFRSGGGQNFELGDGFVKWIFWGIVFISLSSLPLFIGALGIPIQMPSATQSGAWVGTLIGAVNSFSNGFLLGKIVPVAVGALVLKALLDSAEGKSPVPSIISAILALSIKGMYDMVNSWGLSSDQYGVADGLLKVVNWMGSNVCPAIGALCVIGAIINYVRGKPWGQLALTSVAMLCFSGIWILVQSWG